MKLHYILFLVVLVGGVFLWPAAPARAQGDTLVVEWQMPGGDVLVNALRDAIVADTLRPAGRVYKLKAGGYYWNSERIENNGFHLRIVGETPGAGADQNPAVLQMVRRGDATTDGRLITGQDDMTLKNLWITGANDAGVTTFYQPIQIDASGHRFLFDNCIFERSNFAIPAFTGKNNNITFVNCKFRNLIGRPSTQQWEGRGISIWADQDSVIVENNTFFNIEFTAFQLEGGAADYIRFNHNTMVNIGRNFLTGGWWREAYFANNLIINGFWMGEGASDISNPSRDPRAYSSGMMGIGSLPSQYGPEQGRRILLANTASWRDPAFTTYYGDTIRSQPFTNAVTREDFLDMYDNIVARDTTWLGTRPNMPTYPDTLLPKMWKNITDLRRGITPAEPYFYDLPTNPDGSPCEVCVSWPLPEDFSYTTAGLLTAGTDHLPLGDLNWFPAQKAQFEANMQAYIDTLQSLAGPVIVFKPLQDYQAEAGTPSGTATVESFQGFSYYQMDGGGYMEWTFDLPATAQYDLKIWTHMRGNSMRGQHTYINGVEIHDAAHGWGELIYDNASGVTTGMPINEWTWVTWKQGDLKEAGALTMPAGTNTIKISSSWGWQNFAGIDLVDSATQVTVKQLRAPDVTDYSIVMPKGEGAPWVPNGFKSVAMGSNGTITWNINPATSTTYAVQVYYQNYSGASTGSISVDGSPVVPSIPFSSKADSTGLNVLSSYFPLAAGAHTLALTGSNLNVDFIQFIEVVTDVTDVEGLPDSYSLAQNYPNPFNPATRINFSLPVASNVRLSVYNILGQQVALLVNGNLSAGQHSVQFNGRNLASGVYIYRLEAGSFVAQHKMVLLK
jgi:hypothetical protein